MLTKIHIRNFKKLEDVEIELGQSVVLIGPNNSGKTTALQGLALWDVGMRRWFEKRGTNPTARKRPGITINRRDLVAIPVPVANLLWNNLHVRNVERINGGSQRTQNILIDITIEGVTQDKEWQCGLEFDYANAESFYCRPLRIQENQEDENDQDRMPVPEAASRVRVAYLPPMSGLADREFFKQPGEIGVLIGQGQTAQVLRNLCYGIAYEENDPTQLTTEWKQLSDCISNLFGVTLIPPKYIAERSEVVMSYREPMGVELDISSSGRGLQQTLLLFAYLYGHPGTALLLDEPDAHLEILRQRQIYQLLTKIAEEQGSQIIAASHSEVVLNEAADRDIVIAFVGKPHRINVRGSQTLKSLREIGFEDYYQAEQTGWVLYLEGSTDLAILQTFADTLKHPAVAVLEKPFMHTVDSNEPQKARDHFFGLREAKGDLKGIALFDHLNKELEQNSPLILTMWQRREIENYLCQEGVLMRYARGENFSDLFSAAESTQRERAMREAIAEVTAAQKITHVLQADFNPWSPDIKATNEFLDLLFNQYFKKLGLPNLLRKTSYYELARLVRREEIDPEVSQKLDQIVSVARAAHPILD